MNRNDDVCEFNYIISESTLSSGRARFFVEHCTKEGLSRLLDEVEKVGRTPDWRTLKIEVLPNSYGLQFRGEIIATGPRITAEKVQEAIEIRVQEPFRG